MTSGTTEAISQPTLGPLGWLRWMWRQLTSMRTALFLLLLLAVAALPGSTFPQRSINATLTAQWIQDHPTVGPWLDRLGFFEVYASPWFAAIYLLLFVSLIGCVLPRAKVHWTALRQPPPRTPKHLERLPVHASLDLPGRTDGADPTDEQILQAARRALVAKRFTVTSHEPGTLSAERGHLKETGNLLFHLSLIGILIGVAWGHLLGWKGDAIVPVGQTFANTLARYDSFNPGPWVDPSDLAPWALKVDDLKAVFNTSTINPKSFGAARDFTAYTTFTPTPGAEPSAETIEVNHPLETGAGSVFLLGNGYAPKITVRDGSGRVIYSAATPFLAQDNLYKSVGAVKVTGAPGKDLGFSGFFLPTGVIDEQGPRSVFPDALDPALALTVFEGNLFPGNRPQSVYTLDTAEMTQVRNEKGTDALRIWVTKGQTFTLPGGRGSITLEDTPRFAGLSIRSDPGKGLTLVSALLALAGLVTTLTVKRRRVFVRVRHLDDEGRTVVAIGGLGKDEDDGLDDLLSDVLTDVKGHLKA